MPEANIIFVNIEVYFSQWQNQRVYFSQLQNLRPYLLYIISGEKYFWTQKSLSGGMLGFKHRTTSHQKKKSGHRGDMEIQLFIFRSQYTCFAP